MIRASKRIPKEYRLFIAFALGYLSEHLVKSLFLSEGTVNFRQRTWRNKSGTNVEAYVLRTASHTIRRYFTNCQGRKTIHRLHIGLKFRNHKNVSSKITLTMQLWHFYIIDSE